MTSFMQASCKILWYEASYVFIDNCRFQQIQTLTKSVSNLNIKFWVHQFVASWVSKSCIQTKVVLSLTEFLLCCFCNLCSVSVFPLHWELRKIYLNISIKNRAAVKTPQIQKTFQILIKSFRALMRSFFRSLDFEVYCKSATRHRTHHTDSGVQI